MKTELDAGSFFLSDPTRNPKLAAELIRGGSFVLCYAIMVSWSFV